MSKTEVATGATLAKQVYDETLFRDSVKETFFGAQMMSGKGDKPVYVKSDLEKGKGETLVFGLRMRATGAGVTGDATLEGNEEKLNLYSLTSTLQQYRHAVRDEGALSRQRPAFDLEDEMVQAIKDWGTEKLDQLCFDALGIGSGATSDPTKVFYTTSAGLLAGSAATAKAALTAADSKISPAMVMGVKAWAKTGGGRAYVPIRGVKIDSKELYLITTHPDSLFDLKTNSTYQQFIRDAEVRGPTNPLFTGAVAIIDGTVIHENEKCAVATDGGGASVPWVKASFFGQQALCWGWGKRPKLIERDFDYGDELGKAWAVICSAKRSAFNSLDYGSVGLWMARSNIAGL